MAVFRDAADTEVSKIIEKCGTKLERSQPLCGKLLIDVFLRSCLGRYSYRPLA
ncbi:MAG: hypothetical protein PHI56_04035 [Victivallaceae bacterium]|nr:hypothetical protein [Victivallaceae bacterium]MDD3703265.1 hypothetical protein [Victivallaceae bacterium]